MLAQVFTITEGIDHGLNAETLLNMSQKQQATARCHVQEETIQQGSMEEAKAKKNVLVMLLQETTQVCQQTASRQETSSIRTLGLSGARQRRPV